jgi:hypothetical protein
MERKGVIMRIGAFAIVLGGAGLVVACGGAVADEDSIRPDAMGVETMSKGKKAAPQLNLSHIECTETGVNAHFVLLFAGSDEPGPISGAYLLNGAESSFGPVDPDKNTGNVWHYNVALPSGDIEITSATAKGANLHNPGEYAGAWNCTEEAGCPGFSHDPGTVCREQPFGSPENECGFFGLQVEGKDDGLVGLEHQARQDALLAIVKSGNDPCGPGNAAYQTYVNVKAGDVLLTPGSQDISHVTYCKCPAGPTDISTN